MKLNLEAKTEFDKCILNYLEENASEALAEKINTGKKNLAQCFAFIKGEAKKEAKNGCAAIEEKKVFGWAVHFFEEDSIKAVDEDTVKATVSTQKASPKPEPKKPEPKKVEMGLSGQMSLLDFA